MHFQSASLPKPLDPASENRRATSREFFEKKDWSGLWTFKRTCKKSWEALGFNKKEIESIKFYKPDWI